MFGLVLLFELFHFSLTGKFLAFFPEPCPDSYRDFLLLFFVKACPENFGSKKVKIWDWKGFAV